MSLHRKRKLTFKTDVGKKVVLQDILFIHVKHIFYSYIVFLLKAVYIIVEIENE